MVYRTIGLIGPDASAAIPRLLAFFQREDYFKPSLASQNYSLRNEVALALAIMGPDAQKAVITRDAVWATSLILLATSPPSNVTVASLAEIEKRSWIPLNGRTTIEVLRALYRVDPDASRHLGLPVPIRPGDDDPDD